MEMRTEFARFRPIRDAIQTGSCGESAFSVTEAPHNERFTNGLTNWLNIVKGKIKALDRSARPVWRINRLTILLTAGRVKRQRRGLRIGSVLRQNSLRVSHIRSAGDGSGPRRRARYAVSATSSVFEHGSAGAHETILQRFRA